jgi:hypothetical protein
LGKPAPGGSVDDADHDIVKQIGPRVAAPFDAVHVERRRDAGVERIPVDVNDLQDGI